MFPANRLPIPIYIIYDRRGERARKKFEDGLRGAARRFYAAKLREGKRPEIRRADA